MSQGVFVNVMLMRSVSRASVRLMAERPVVSIVMLRKVLLMMYCDSARIACFVAFISCRFENVLSRYIAV
jgi:hypothetical protein